MAVSLAKLGSLMIDINVNVLTASFISPQGEVLDRYEIKKQVKEKPLHVYCN
jgi:hypothetical protein